ncbi:hypothetical protein [Providencia sp. PROV209]|uniref:hypothetical protein n=1 Tax=Providencia sp. PROV209 TaxID=2949906 RepID=UPI0023490EE3|nr:hypothetical protein [Providencia sp. PROV209]
MRILGYIISAAVIIILIIIVISNSTNPTKADAISFAKKQVSQSMKDPSSTEFKFVEFYPSSKNQKEEIYGFVCGSVNAKNSFGAYTGFTRFTMNISVTNNGRSANMSPPLFEDLNNPVLNDGFEVLWKENCRDK